MLRRLAAGAIFPEPDNIKHSLPTAWRQAVSRVKSQVIRIAPKAAPPTGRLICGLVGAGQFFNYAYLPALNRKNSPLAIAGILARDEKKFRAAQRGLRYTTRHFTDFDAMLASGINSVLILLPNHLHLEFARRALEHGLNVFCEKPLAQNINDLLTLKKALVEKSAASEVTRLKTSGNQSLLTSAATLLNKPVLMVDFNQRYLDRNHVLQSCLAQERLGKIQSVHAFHNQDLRGLKSFNALHRDITGGGVTHNAGIHFINLFLHWFGEPERVQAVFENRALPRECGEDTAHCRFWFRNGVTATLDASLANAVDTTYERVHFAGTDGEIFSDLKKGNILCRQVHPETNRAFSLSSPKEEEGWSKNSPNPVSRFEPANPLIRPAATFSPTGGEGRDEGTAVQGKEAQNSPDQIPSPQPSPRLGGARESEPRADAGGLKPKPLLNIPCQREIISDSVFNALKHFAACVQNQLPPETGIDDFIATMKTVEALTLSAQRGAEVSLAEIENKYA